MAILPPLVIPTLAAVARPVSLSWLIRHDIVPVGCAFLGVVGAGWWYVRRSLRPGATPPLPASAPTGPGSRAEWWRLLRYAFGVTLGGYLVFALIIGVFYLVLGDAGSKYLRQGFGLGAVLAFGIALPGFLAISALAELWRLARGRFTGSPGARR
jgi:Family of unknown function (DUF6256)